MQFHAADWLVAVSKELGMTLSNFQRSLAAVLVGNLIYFAIMPILPPALRHGVAHPLPPIDLGLLIDFLICTALFVLFGRWLPDKKGARTNPHP
jgi:Kef-type K+ transport system membrane component KefB